MLFLLLPVHLPHLPVGILGAPCSRQIQQKSLSHAPTSLPRSSHHDQFPSQLPPPRGTPPSRTSCPRTRRLPHPRVAVSAATALRRPSPAAHGRGVARVS